MGFEPPVLDQQHGMPQQDQERREYIRREEDHGSIVPTVVSALLAICGAFAALFLFFALMGQIDLGDAIVATVLAALAGLIWFSGFWYRHRTAKESGRMQRADRERRGF
jgi:hypothetical protein